MGEILSYNIKFYLTEDELLIDKRNLEAKVAYDGLTASILYCGKKSDASIKFHNFDKKVRFAEWILVSKILQ